MVGQFQFRILQLPCGGVFYGPCTGDALGAYRVGEFCMRSIDKGPSCYCGKLSFFYD